MSKDSVLSNKLKFDQENNHKKGFCSFDGQTAMQNYKAFGAVWDLIEEVKPNTIIEIGTAAGGFTRFLKAAVDDLNFSCKVISYDVNQVEKRKLLLDLGIDYREEDCFGKNSESNLFKLKNDIQSSGTTIVFCDGGHKITEFNILSDFLKLNDIILAHDYSYSKEVFEKDIKPSIWSWCEVTYDRIKDSVERNNLQPFHQDSLNKVVWACFKKL